LVISSGRAGVQLMHPARLTSLPSITRALQFNRQSAGASSEIYFQRYAEKPAG
jgi:hypothetical protein